MSEEALQVFRLKRKWSQDPQDLLSLSMKKLKRNDKNVVVPDVLKLARSFNDPIAPDFQNASYYDLDLVEEDKLDKEIEMSLEPIDDVAALPCLNDKEDISRNLETRKATRKSRYAILRSSSPVTCNGIPMARIKHRKRSSPDGSAFSQDDSYIYDFYIPNTYDAFREGLLDKLRYNMNCQDGIEGLKTIASNEGLPAHSPSCVGSVESYYHGNFDLRRMVSSSSSFRTVDQTLRNGDNQDIVNGDGSDLSGCGSFEENYYNSTRTIHDFEEEEEDDDDDSDSNGENNWRNDYPDEDDACSDIEDPSTLTSFHNINDSRLKQRRPYSSYLIKDQDRDGDPDESSVFYKRSNKFGAGLSSSSILGDDHLTSKFGHFDLAEDSD